MTFAACIAASKALGDQLLAQRLTTAHDPAKLATVAIYVSRPGLEGKGPGIQQGSKALGGLGGVSFGAQLIGTTMGVAWALAGGFVVYGILKRTVGLRLTQEEEFDGADLSIHKISATPDREVSW